MFFPPAAWISWRGKLKCRVGSTFDLKHGETSPGCSSLMTTRYYKQQGWEQLVKCSWNLPPAPVVDPHVAGAKVPLAILEGATSDVSYGFHGMMVP